MTTKDEDEKESVHDIILRGMRIAANKAKAEHKAKKIPIAIAVDGKVVIIQPEDIVVDDTDLDPTST